MDVSALIIFGNLILFFETSDIPVYPYPYIQLPETFTIIGSIGNFGSKKFTKSCLTFEKNFYFKTTK